MLFRNSSQANMPKQTTSPLIGITTSRISSRYGYPTISLPEAYTQAVQRAGGVPILIPLSLDPAALQTILFTLDGVLFSGGGDIHPHRYGAPVHPLVDSVDEDRDEVELTLVSLVLERKLPFLGICRGLQLINVALGGSLYEDLGTQYPGSLEHDCFLTYGRDYLAHPVRVESGSQLSEILQSDNVQVNSLHHQGVRVLAPGLRCTAQAPDGVIEAFELPDYLFGLAVQWHPEWLPGNMAMRGLFEAFIETATHH